jgi:hypothetical protein
LRQDKIHYMENLFVTFPSWSISDGNYNPFQKGQKVNFALNIENAKIRKSLKKQCYLKQRTFAEYSFCAKVIGNYSQEGMDGHFLVLETGLYKFFMHSYGNKFSYQEGEFIVGKGELAVDYFIWGEQSYKIQDVPDIYFDFVIEKILHIKFPIEYTTFNDEVIISHASLSSAESEFEIVELENMSDREGESIVLEEQLNDNNIATYYSRSFTLFILKRVGLYPDPFLNNN